MKTITVNASQKYNIAIGYGLLDSVVDNLPFIQEGQVAVILSDSNVYPMYGDKLRSSLVSAGLSTIEYIIPAGEQSKNIGVYADILNFLAKNFVSRADLIFALGGGVVGDMAGFVAATYLRGIRYIQVPTTLLAMVDSAIGGKTGINVEVGKNLVGAFYQPSAVICDLSVLKSLPDKIFRDGCAEIIKYAILFDEDLFYNLLDQGLNLDWEDVIYQCAQWKCRIISRDEFDHQDRKLLNFGHSIGHAVEVCSGYTVSHGEAVAIGMHIISRAAEANALCQPGVARQISSLIHRFQLPTACKWNADALCQSIMSDKKRTGEFIDLILPHAIGQCVITPLSVHKLKTFIEAGM